MPDRHASSAAAATVRRDAEDEGPAAARRVRVLLPLPLPDALDYLMPEGAAVPEPGSFVRVPLGGRSLVGVVWDGCASGLPADRLKPVAETLPLPGLTPELRRFVERVAGYTMTSPGAVLHMTMSVGEALQPPRPRRLWTAAAAGRAALDEAASD